MSGVDDIMEDASERSDLVEAARDCESGILLYYDERNIPHVKRIGMTFGDEAFLYMAAMARYFKALIDDEED